MPHWFPAWALAAVLALPAPALAQPALLRDLRPGTQPLPVPTVLDPHVEMTPVGSGKRVFFQATTPLTGRELWSTDGTPEGTRLVVDLAPGPQDSHPHHLTDVNGTLFFRARTGLGDELWKTDGTPQGTVRLLAHAPWVLDSASDPPFLPLPLDGTLYFVGPDREPWKTDGTPQGTVRLKELAPGRSSGVRALAYSWGTLFLLTSTNQLWKSDGTEAGTVPVWHFQDAQVQNLNGLSGAALLVVREASGAFRLWRSNGTEAGTQLVADLPHPGPLGWQTEWGANRGGLRLFLASDTALWGSNGTAGDTGPVASLVRRPRMTVTGGRLLYEQPTALWRTEGTSAGSVKVMDLPPSTELVSLVGQREWSRSYFLTHGGDSGPTLWWTDGTGASVLKRVPPREDGSPAHLSELRAVVSTLFFNVRYGDERLLRPWLSDGTTLGTGPLTSTAREPLGAGPRAWVPLDGFALFAADDDTLGPALWRTDGTPEGTTLVKDLLPGQASEPGTETRLHTARLGDTAFLYTGDTLWRSDGTEAGTVAVKRFGALERPELVRVGATLYFPASHPETGDRELWKSDGTEAGTVPVKLVTPGPQGSEVSRLHALGGALYFRLRDETLWRTDGTPEGTLPVPLPFPSLGGGDHVLAGEALYLQSDDGSRNVTELWKLEGGAREPVRVWSTPAGDLDSPIRGGFARTRGGVIFMRWDAAHGLELWRTDGTQEGTGLLKDLWPGPDSGIRQQGAPEVLTLEDQGLALFAASDGVSGEELWMTDGTPDGTVRVADVRPGPAGSVPRALARLGDRLLFSAVDEAAGLEPHTLPVPKWRDRSPPVLLCPQNVSVETSDSSGQKVSYPPATATDFSGEPTVKYSLASGDTFPVGTTAVTVTATDAGGLSSQCTFEVTVTYLKPPAPDEEPPRPQEPQVPQEPQEPQAPPPPKGCGCTTGGAGPLALWALLAGFASRHRREPSPRKH